MKWWKRVFSVRMVIGADQEVMGRFGVKERSLDQEHLQEEWL